MAMTSELAVGVNDAVVSVVCVFSVETTGVGAVGVEIGIY
jgi:hypothetical protein